MSIKKIITLITLINIFIFINNVFAEYPLCIGNDYEQKQPVEGIKLPFVSIITDVQEIAENGVIQLTADAEIDQQGKAFFYWCADKGHFEYNSTINSDFRVVNYIAPFVSQDEIVKITVQVGDTLGYIDTDTITIKVSKLENVLVKTLNRINGDIQILPINPDILQGIGIVKINGKDIQTNWTSDSITFNIYNAIGQTFDSLYQPVHIEIYGANNNKLYTGYYPFKDVAPNEWYSRPIIKLWKEGVLSGYTESDSNEFKPNKGANRAEYINVAVIADEKANEPTRTYTSYTNSFNDVNADDWFAKYVQYAKDQNIAQGCNPADNLFCPDDTINRAEAVTITDRTFDSLQATLETYKQGKIPSKKFTDVTDAGKWYYPFVYTAMEEMLVNGYSDGSFRPEAPVTRAEMAKINCIAAFGVKDCMFTGELNTPFVTSVFPRTAALDELTTFTVKGYNLPGTTAFWIDQCENIQSLGGTAEEQKFTCTPSYTAGTKDGVVKDQTDGAELYNFTINITETLPVVNSVSPLTATFEEPTIFTVSGENLPDTTAFWIADCADLQDLGGDANQHKFQCTPSNTAGIKNGVVKDQPEGTELLKFTINVQDEYIPPVNNEPVVNSVTPTNAKYQELTTFTVTGSNLPETTSYWIDDCDNLQDLGGTSEQRQFQCTPINSTGIKDGVVKDMSGDAGNILENFTVNVQDEVTPPPPVGDTVVYSVKPDTGTLGVKTTFTVTGENLPDTTAFWIDECINPTPLSGGTSEIRKFTCTPGYKTGSHDGEVKDKPQGTILYDDFSVNFLFGTPKVDSVTPKTVNAGQPTVFTVEGSSLPDTTVIWIDGCMELVSFEGDANKRTFQCTPSGTDSKNGVVKDKSGGTELLKFTVNVQ
ncbi:S-layer homology domain-containing protein [Desulfonema limicola]|uniref:S-layer homology domain-containing protein n=1 Tax=Desulfonema limicola TaxID=45656 RepID=A0A975GK53_9BACT|nr:S-layer homology domain-containing protein [Desulfonema limicola]QTA83458.1 S-layer homology domain-containing protein [Desulfonema limicola]